MHTLDEFGHAVGLSEFFVAVVIVAIVGNAAEHGGAIVVAYRGNMKLAAEIAISSSAQVAVFVAPAVALLSWIVGPGLPFTFRPVELATMGARRRGRGRRGDRRPLEALGGVRADRRLCARRHLVLPRRRPLDERTLRSIAEVTPRAGATLDGGEKGRLLQPPPFCSPWRRPPGRRHVQPSARPSSEHLKSLLEPARRGRTWRMCRPTCRRDTR